MGASDFSARTRSAASSWTLASGHGAAEEQDEVPFRVRRNLAEDSKTNTGTLHRHNEILKGNESVVRIVDEEAVTAGVVTVS